MAFLDTATGRWINRNLPRLFGLWFMAFALLLGSSPKAPAEAPSLKEYQVKAAFLFNFAQFVEWPTNAFPKAPAPFVIGILGNDPFGTALDEIVRGEKVSNRPFVVQRYQQTEEIKACHVLFINESSNKRLAEILAELKGKNILTVGDTEGFARQGGMICFMTEKNKIRFRINVEAAKSAGLTISSKLLKAAEIVAPEKR